MKFSYFWLKDIVGFKETPQKLAEILTLRSFELEGIEKVGKDYALDIKITANRLADAAGHLGLAREIAAITSARFEAPRISLRPTGKKFGIDLDIIPSDLCSRYAAQLVEISEFVPSPRWLQERLITCGLRPIRAEVDVTNYVMLETGHPLHAFDVEKIIGRQMLVRESKKGEEVTTLDGVKRVLPEGVIVIQDRDRIIDCAGIMGGENSAVSAETKIILLQAAVFDPTRMYRASTLLGLATAASKLYAAGVDGSASMEALERAVSLLEEIAGARRMGLAFDWYPEKAVPTKILFRPDYADSIIGRENGITFYQRVFERLGFGFKKQGANLFVEVPPRRHDIVMEEDLIEEAARLLGYENIVPKFPEVAVAPGVVNRETAWEEEATDRLVAAGFTESEMYEFTGEQELAEFFYQGSKPVEMANPMSMDQRYLAPRLLIKYAVSVKENLKNEDTVKIFGFGKSFVTGEQGIIERKDLVIALGRKGGKGEDEFYEMKGVIDGLLESLGIEEYEYKIAKDASVRHEFAMFHPFRSAEIIAEGKVLGMIGEIHPEISENIKSKGRIVVAELLFDRLWKLADGEQQYRPIGKYPAVRRDIAVLVSFNTTTQEIVNIIETVGGELLIETELFDYFQDEEMQGVETKSLAFHLIFESPERTLKDEEVETRVNAITRALEEKDWEVRK